MGGPADITGEAARAAAELRARARSLRDLRRRVEASPALDLHRRAGPDTWRGPSSRACADDLAVLRARLLAAADHLAAEARRLDRLASELERSPRPW